MCSASNEIFRYPVISPGKDIGKWAQNLNLKIQEKQTGKNVLTI